MTSSADRIQQLLKQKELLTAENDKLRSVLTTARIVNRIFNDVRLTHQLNAWDEFCKTKAVKP